MQLLGVKKSFTRNFAVLSLLTLAACSSVPDFKPAKPLEEARSLNEALDLCAAYQIKGEQNASGRALYSRSVTLMPWIYCFESIFRKFPEARDRESFVMFFRALQSRHDGIPTPTSEVIDWPQMNYAVTHAVTHIKDASLAFSEEESRVLERQFPGYWIYLAEKGRLQTPLTRTQVRSMQLGEMRTEIEGKRPVAADDTAAVPTRPMPLTDEQKDYCKRYRDYRQLLYTVEDLSEYKRMLDEHTRDDVANANEKTMRERVEKRYAALKTQAQENRRQLDQDLLTLQGKASWFRNGHCLEGKAPMKRKNP